MTRKHLALLILLALTLMYGCATPYYNWSQFCNPVRPVQVTWKIDDAKSIMTWGNVVFLSSNFAYTKFNCSAGTCEVRSTVSAEAAKHIIVMDGVDDLYKHEMAHCEGEIHD